MMADEDKRRIRKEEKLLGDRRRLTTTKEVIVFLARLARDNKVLGGALGDAKVGARDQKVGGVGCASPLLTTCAGQIGD